MKQCDIVLLPVPFSDQTSKKVRPAVVVSNDRINTTSEDIILVPLTSILKEVPYSVLVSQKNLAKGELIAVSRVRADKVFTAHKSLVRMNVGTINRETMDLIKQELFNALS